MQPQLLGKTIAFCASQPWNDTFAGIEGMAYTKLAHDILKKFPHDMLVFETKNNQMTVRLAGYNLQSGILDEQTIVYKTKSLPTKTFWLKVDDYGEKFIATFLFPEDY